MYNVAHLIINQTPNHRASLTYMTFYQIIHTHIILKISEEKVLSGVWLIRQ